MNKGHKVKYFMRNKMFGTVQSTFENNFDNIITKFNKI